MRALFILYVPVFFSATNDPKLPPNSTVDARGRAGIREAWPNSVPLHQSPVLQPMVDPYVEVLVLHYKCVGWSTTIASEPYCIYSTEYSFGASQASSLVNQPLLNWNKLCCRHPLESISSFVHPIPFVSTVLLIVSLVILWVILSIIMLNWLWYICWHCVSQINPLLAPVEKKMLHVESTSSKIRR